MCPTIRSSLYQLGSPPPVANWNFCGPLSASAVSWANSSPGCSFGFWVSLSHFSHVMCMCRVFQSAQNPQCTQESSRYVTRGVRVLLTGCTWFLAGVYLTVQFPFFKIGVLVFRTLMVQRGRVWGGPGGIHLFFDPSSSVGTSCFRFVPQSVRPFPPQPFGGWDYVLAKFTGWNANPPDMAVSGDRAFKEATSIKFRGSLTSFR